MVRRGQKRGYYLIISTSCQLTKPLKRRSGMTTFARITCAYCGHARKLPIFKANSEEHTWCIKCCKTSRFNFGTDTAYKLEDIRERGEHDTNR